MKQQALKGFDGCEQDSPKKPELPPFKYLEVEVSREQYTNIYLKVPGDFDTKRLHREGKIIGEACRKTTTPTDWDCYGWESNVTCERIKEVTEREATCYEVYEVKL